jgi:transposase
MSQGNPTVSLGAVSLGVGIDTARYGHHVSFLDGQKRTAAKAFHFTESAAGYQQLQAALTKLAEKHPGLHFHIRLDAAGQYAENLLQWLHRLPFSTTISVGQPARNKAYRQVHFDKRKSDPVESLACARFAIVERPAATPHNPPEFQQLRDAVALMESSAKQRTRLINQLHGLLARVFPELAVSVKDLSANWVLSLLEKYPTPDKLARAKPEMLAKIPHLATDMAETLRAAAKHSTASNRGPIAAELIRQKVHAIRQEQETFAALATLVEQAWQALPDGPAKRLRTIPGIGLQTSAALVAKIVAIERFATPTALIGYFGVFPEEVDVSGTDRQGNPKHGTEIHMSRKGNDLVRRLLYTAAQCAVTWNPPVKALFARLRADGKEYNVCLGHCMAKLLRQVFALWTKDCDFDPDFEAPSKAAAESASHELRACETQTIVAHKNADLPHPDPVLGESQQPGTNAPRVSRNRAQKKGTPQASKGGAPVQQEVTMTSPTHLPPSGPRSVALPQSRPPSAQRPVTVRAANE